MPDWKPDIAADPGAKYLAIAKALADDVASGALAAGTRLPPQRALAEALGVDLTTVTRAYGEAQRLGLIEGDGRRGSFVRAPAEPPRPLYREPADAGMNAPPEPAVIADAFRRAADGLLSQAPAPFQYQPSGGMPFAREAGARLLQKRALACREDTVLVTAGGQHALHAVISAALSPGDALAVTPYAYPGLLALARRYGLRLVTITADAEGMDPDALDAACATERLAALYIVPTNDNPTTATMGAERRDALAGVARRHGLAIIEDDAYGLLPAQPMAPVAAAAPERSWHIASVSKILSPGLRVAWLAAPDVGKAWRVAADMHETAIMAPPLNAAIVADWAESGELHTLAGAVRGEAEARQAIARACLPQGSFRAQPEGYHLWVPLPAGADPADIVATLRGHGLSAVGSEAFAVDRAAAAPALRVSIGGTLSREKLERGLRLLGALIGPEAGRRAALV